MTDQDQLHTALLNLGGRVPDAMLAEARLTLADTGTVTLPAPESTIELAFTFTAAKPGERAFSKQAPPLTDLTGLDGLMDEPDRVAAATTAQLTGTVALWRSWRIAPEWAAQVIPPAPLYVLETNGPKAQAAAAVMRALAAAGITAPLVEVYSSGEKLPAYTAAARNSSALIWTDRDTGPIRLARVFDVVDAAGARFTPDHERLTGDDLAQVAAYLDAGSPVLATTSRVADVVEPVRGDVVPISYRTDGHWLWPESVGYYLQEYGLAPEPEFTAHIRSKGRLFPFTDPADEHRAIAVLFQSHAVFPVA
ncbi:MULTISPECIES: hypothetical protein [Actinoplanes]|uniref:hypothetical protein n=1 Tax=Actinoplanes TaxID=1865 RepID=UPI0005F2EA98|nr:MULTISPECIES: hypothetical protein [Actinoplanes]GLY00689.1 hypothetical protein Acsp01_10680 [Actinoplanes sp. NBRC 101535]